MHMVTMLTTAWISTHQKENDTVVSTDKEIDVILANDQPLLNGVKIDYLYFPEEGFVITNPSQGNHGDH